MTIALNNFVDRQIEFGFSPLHRNEAYPLKYKKRRR